MDNRKWESGAAATPPDAPAAPSTGYPTDGDPLASVPPTIPGAHWFYQIGEELRAVLTAAGLTPSTASNAQLLEAIQLLIDAQSGNYAPDTGAANAYVVALSPAITAYGDGMTVRVKAVNANTGASTLNAGGGVVSLVNDVGGALANGDIPAGGIFTATYIASGNKFYMTSLVASQALTQAQADERYAALAGLATQLFDVGAGTGVNHAIALGQILSNAAVPGYLKIPVWNGSAKDILIIQWGNWNSSITPGNPVAVTFPIAFPTVVYGVALGASYTSTSTTSVWKDSLATTGFNGRCNINTGDTNHYIAIGK